jgi:hypothetical protein
MSMKKLSAKVFYHLLAILPFFAFFFMVTPTHAEAVSLYSPASIYQREKEYNFEIHNPAKDVEYSVWVDKQNKVQKKVKSIDGSAIKDIAINVQGVTADSPKKVCLTDEVISDNTYLIYLFKGDLCKWSVSIYVTQNPAPPQNPQTDSLDSATNPIPKSRPDSGVSIAIDHSNFKQNEIAKIVVKNPQKEAQYYLWVDQEDDHIQVTTPRGNPNNTSYNLNIGKPSPKAKKICMNDVELSASDRPVLPSNYECRWFVTINVTQNTPEIPGKAVDSKTDPNAEDREKSRGKVELRMDYTNYLHDTKAGFHITNPVKDAQYYVWVDKDKKPQQTKRAKSTDEINDLIDVGEASSSPKKVCLNDVEFGWQDNLSAFPTDYECRLYVIINVTKDTPTDQGKPVSSNDNPQGGAANDKLSPTPTPVPILPPCIEGENSSGAPVIIPTFAPDQSNKSAYDTAMSQVSKCTKVDSAIGPISTDPAGFILKLFQIFLSISGGIALIIIIGAGYRYMMSQGNAEAIKAAQEQITSAIVGLLFLVFSMVLLQVIGVDILHLPGFSPPTQVSPGPNNIK